MQSHISKSTVKDIVVKSSKNLTVDNFSFLSHFPLHFEKNVLFSSFSEVKRMEVSCFMNI